MTNLNVVLHNGVRCIDSFELYNAIKLSESNYCRWVKTSICQMGTENIDYYKSPLMIFDQTPKYNYKRYFITLLFACELSAAAKTKTGIALKYEIRRILGINVKL